MTMTANHKQEQFSLAYIHAVATDAGLKVFPPAAPDDDSVDLSIGTRGVRGTVRSPRIDVQLKCHRGDVSGDTIAFPLKIKNFDELRHEDYLVPRFLVLVMVPEAENEWVTHDLEQLVLRRCGFWHSLRGMAETANTSTVTVHVPVANALSPLALGNLVNRGGRS